MEKEFRVWDGEKMHYPKESFESSFGPFCINQNGLCYINGILQNIVVMFWTGAVDSNGRRIYDGDYIRFGNLGHAGYDKCLVRWDPKNFQWLARDIDFHTVINHRDDPDGGVYIEGNKYQQEKETP